MKNECSIIRDLLPLYAENMVSCDTADFVEEHLADCESCRKAYEETKEPQEIQDLSDAVPLKTISRKLRAKKIQTIIMTAVFVAAFLVWTYAVLDSPYFLPYTEGLVTAEVYGDKGLLLTFDEEVTDFRCNVYADDDNGEVYYCEIEAWTSLWDQWFSKENRKLSYIVTTEKPLPINIEYVPNNETDNACIARYVPGGEKRIEKYENSNGGTVVLPRLERAVYLVIAAITFILFMAAWLLTRKKTKVRIWIERIALFPLAYIISTCIISGTSLTSYSIMRDFLFIIMLSILLYSGMLLLHNIWQMKKEIREKGMDI